MLEYRNSQTWQIEQHILNVKIKYELQPQKGNQQAAILHQEDHCVLELTHLYKVAPYLEVIRPNNWFHQNNVKH